MIRPLASIILLSSVAPCLAAQQAVNAATGTTALLQAVSPVDASVVWASGHRGTVLRSTDGGMTWQARVVAGAEPTLQFRDIHGASAEVAWVMSAGNGTQSQIWHTRDGGVTWARQFLNTDSTAFYDCLAFFDARTAVAFSDASQGRTTILRTTDAGATWALLPAEAVPAPLEGEGAFAASGGCVTTFGSRDGWMALGAPAARLLRSRDGGATWAAHATPLVAGASAGATAVHFRDPLTGILVGGDIGNYNADTSRAVVAVTADGGATWQLRARPPRPGALFGVTWVPDAGPATAVAASPGGLFLTRDAGETWSTLDERAFWSVAAVGRRAWAVGPGGLVLVLTF